MTAITKTSLSVPNVHLATASQQEKQTARSIDPTNREAATILAVATAALEHQTSASHQASSKRSSYTAVPAQTATLRAPSAAPTPSQATAEKKLFIKPTPKVSRVASQAPTPQKTSAFVLPRPQAFAFEPDTSSATASAAPLSLTPKCPPPASKASPGTPQAPAQPSTPVPLNTPNKRYPIVYQNEKWTVQGTPGLYAPGNSVYSLKIEPEEAKEDAPTDDEDSDNEEFKPLEKTQAQQAPDVVPSQKEASSQEKDPFELSEPESAKETTSKPRTFETKRYIGESARPLSQRAHEHARSAAHPRGTSLLANAFRKLKPDENGKIYAKLSIGRLAKSPSPQPLGDLESQAIEKVAEAYGPESLLNERKGGGGGTVVEGPDILTPEEIQERLPSLEKFSWKDLSQKCSRKSSQLQICHNFGDEIKTKDKMIYIFERTFPKTKQTKRYVGLSGNLKKRLSSHISHANHPENSTLKTKTLYEDLHQFWKQFRLGIISVQSIVDAGTTVQKIERVAIQAFDGLKKSDGTGGYNLNPGGGGGATK